MLQRPWEDSREIIVFLSGNRLQHVRKKVSRPGLSGCQSSLERFEGKPDSHQGRDSADLFSPAKTCPHPVKSCILGMLHMSFLADQF